nr:uncharacterized protein LOC109158743 [Ipomoea trifida]
MLSNQSANQSPAGVSAEEADLIRRSKKKTKRGAHERDDDSSQMDEDGQDNSSPELQKLAGGQTGIVNQTTKSPTISFRRALTGMRDREERKSRNYQINEDHKWNNGRNKGGKNDASKGKGRGNQGNISYQFNKEGFKIWNNSRYGALENLDEEDDEEAQEEPYTMDRPDGPSGEVLAGKGKRPQVQITEAQLLNDRTGYSRGAAMEKQKVYREKQGDKSTSKSNNRGNQAAGSESHTVVRGFNNGNRVEKTVVTEEGNTTEVFQFQAEVGDHHQDPPDNELANEQDDIGDPMMEVEFAEGHTSAGNELAGQ